MKKPARGSSAGDGDTSESEPASRRSTTGAVRAGVEAEAGASRRSSVGLHRAIGLAAASLVPLFAVTRAQVRHWADSTSLFDHALAVTSNNMVAHNNLGQTLYQQGKTEQEAMGQFREALRIQPGLDDARANLQQVEAALKQRS